jgi:hypothetical protein
VFLPSTIVSGVLVLGLWLPARGVVPITMFSALYGLFSGELDINLWLFTKSDGLGGSFVL